MSQYSHTPSPLDADMMSEPPRTSAMAVTSLVLSLVGCCLPIGLLGSLLGIFSLLGISGSQGRVTGRGLAIAAVIIGVINTGIWVGAGMAVVKGFDAYSGMTSGVLADVEAGDYRSVRGVLDPALKVSDAQLDAFRDAYHAELGAYTGIAENVFEFIGDFMDPNVRPKISSYQGRQDMRPIAGRFDKGKTVILFLFDRQSQGGGGPIFNDIVIVLPNGDELKLSGVAVPGEAPGGDDSLPDTDG